MLKGVGADHGPDSWTGADGELDLTTPKAKAARKG
jgi:hypothetical protein